MANLTVRFYEDKKQLGAASEHAGHPVFTECDMLEITVPGDSYNVINREATDKDKHEYAAAYARYKQGLEPSVEGMPIEQWSRLTAAAAANYKAQGIKSVEQLAELSDLSCNKIGMGSMGDRTAAKAFLALAKDSALAQKQALEIERLTQLIEGMQEQMKELGEKSKKRSKEET